MNTILKDVLDTLCFTGFFDEWKVQKNSIYLKYKYFVAFLKPLLINVLHPCRTFTKETTDTNGPNIDFYIDCYSNILCK